MRCFRRRRTRPPPYFRYLDLVRCRSLVHGVLTPLPTADEMAELTVLSEMLSPTAGLVIRCTRESFERT